MLSSSVRALSVPVHRRLGLALAELVRYILGSQATHGNADSWVVRLSQQLTPGVSCSVAASSSMPFVVILS